MSGNLSPPFFEPPPLGGGGGPPTHSGGPTLLSTGAAVEREDNTSSLVYLPVPTAYSVGDLLIAIGVVAPQSGGPSAPLFQPFPGGYYTTLKLGQSFIVDAVFGDFVCNISARIATGDADDGLVALTGQPRGRFGQIAAFSGMPSSLTSITERSGDTEYAGSTDLKSETVLTGLGTDTLAILVSQRIGNASGNDDGVSIGTPPQGPLAMDTIHSVNLPSNFGVGNLIAGWCYASRGETDERAGDAWGSTYDDSQQTLSTYVSLKASGYT